MSITIKDGLVIYRAAAGNRPQVVWADCERCGTQPPIVDSDGYHMWLQGTGSIMSRWGRCSLCEGDSHLRYVTWRESKRKHAKCDKRCLEGENECNCGCQGKCHGLEVCSCKKEE